MDARRVASQISGWIAEQVRGAGARGTVVGLSGGLDSAVTAALCAMAFPDATLGVVMPCNGRARDVDDAALVCRAFRVPCVTVDLGPACGLLLEGLERALPGDGEAADDAGRAAPGGAAGPAYPLPRANLRPRLRMAALYYIAGTLNRLVVGTGNRSELAVGYFTKYGDGGVDILPIGGLVKGEVRELGRYLGVPREILDKPPSAGLWEGQTDEGELGFSYDVLDAYLLTGGAPAGPGAAIEARMIATGHKLKPPPIPPLPRH